MNLERAAMMAQDLINLYCPSFKFTWDDRSTARLGACWKGSRRIALSVKLTSINSEDNVLNTILHEIAHALTMNELDHHGPMWRAKARELNCPDQALSYNHVRVKPKYYYECPSCQRRWYRTRQWLKPRVCKRDRTVLVQHFNW